MHNEGRLFSQVAAEAHVTSEKAMVACYLANLAKDGKTLDEAATLLRKPRYEARDVARDWGIVFSDYSPATAPLPMDWAKEKRGRWILAFDGLIIAEAVSDGAGGYHAWRLAGEKRIGTRHEGSNAEVAIRRLSIALERDSVAIFGVDEIRIGMPDPDGAYIALAPKIADNRAELCRALAA